MTEGNSELTPCARATWQALEEVKVREMAILDLQKKIMDGENKLKQQQNLYEAVRSERNLYSKNLIEAQVRAPARAHAAFFALFRS